MTAGADKTVRLWRPDTGSLLKTYIGHGFEVLDVQGSLDNSQLCSGGTDKQVIVWDVSTGEPLRRLRYHAGTVNTVRYNADSSVIISTSIDGKVALWDCRSRTINPIQVLNEARDSVTTVAIHDWCIVTGSLDSYARRYDIRKGNLTSDYVGHPVTCVTVTRDGQCLLTSCQDGKLRLFDITTGELLNEYTGHSNTKYKVDSCILQSDTHVASGSEDGRVLIWELLTARCDQKLPHRGASVVHSLSPHPKKNNLLSATGDTFHVWTPQDSDSE